MERVQAIVLAGAVRLTKRVRLLAVLGVKAIACLVVSSAFLALFGSGSLVLARGRRFFSTYALIVVTRLVVVSNPLSCLLRIYFGSALGFLEILLAFSSPFHLEVLLYALSVAFLCMGAWYRKLSVQNHR